MRNKIKFHRLAKKTLITSSPLLLALSISEIGRAGEIPSKTTPITPVFIDSQPQNPSTSVYRLSDVKPSDWAFQAWQSLAERYDCPTANLDTRPSENRPISRYEFAAGLYGCLDRLSNLSDDIESKMSTEDFELLQRLQGDFATELSSLASSVENLEITTQQLEDNLFSTTTQFRGEVVFQLTDSFGASIDSDEDETQAIFGSRFRLNFLTSFFGTDVLRARIGSANTGSLEDITGTVMSRLAIEGDDNNQASGEITYRFLVGDRTSVGIGTSGAGIQNAGEVLNPLSSSSRGAISRFARRDPITLRGSGSAGITIQQELRDGVQVGLGYSTGNSEAPDRGLFNSSYNAIAQIALEPTNKLELAFTYTRKYQEQDDVNLMSDTGSDNANNPFDDNATISDGFSFQFNWFAADKLEIGAWVGYAEATQKQGGDGEATIVNGALTLAFPDLGGEGNLGGIIVGVPPIVTEHDDPELEDEETSWHIEALYRISLTDNIEITPGFFVITNPNHEDNEAIWVGTIRSLFSF